MPKEAVHGSFLSGSDPDDPSVVEVRWDREASHFQIVTRLRSAEIPSPEEQQPEIPARFGWYVDLDRRGINQLIRNLRRARDQAFGRDE